MPRDLYDRWCITKSEILERKLAGADICAELEAAWDQFSCNNLVSSLITNSVQGDMKLVLEKMICEEIKNLHNEHECEWLNGLEWNQ